MRRIDLRSDRSALIPRPPHDQGSIEHVREVLREVETHGDEALVRFTERFDGVRIEAGELRVSGDEIDRARDEAPADLLEAIAEAASRLRAVSEHHLVGPWEEEIGGGRLGESVHPVGVAGFYVPGGRAVYPSVLMMSAVPAEVAGVKRRFACIPPGPGGQIPGATLAAAAALDVREIYRVGGPQAIAAMAYGTETIPRADVITGGGGLYVALAKREVAGSAGIDSVAGPSEIAIVADASADPRLIAADLIAQAEHGPHGAFALITWDEALGASVDERLSERLGEMGSPDLREALERGAVMALVSDLDHALDAVAEFAPEHVELLFDGAEAAAWRVRNSGAIFVGPHSPVSLGDYAAGSNHTLPTMGAARWASGLRASVFQRVSTVVHYEEKALRASARYVRAFAEAEGLPLHAEAVDARFEEDS